jgi:hypothetical protein
MFGLRSDAVVVPHGVSVFRFGDPHRTPRSAFEGFESEPETRGNSGGCAYLIA